MKLAWNQKTKNRISYKSKNRKLNWIPLVGSNQFRLSFSIKKRILNTQGTWDIRPNTYHMYMIDFIAEVYETRLIFSSSSLELGHLVLLNVIPCCIGTNRGGKGRHDMTKMHDTKWNWDKIKRLIRVCVV